jgi:hypothetical protein
MVNCKEASRLMSQGLDRDLGLAQRTSLHFHLFLCTTCSRVKRQFDFMRSTAAQFPGPEDDGGPRKREP